MSSRYGKTTKAGHTPQMLKTILRVVNHGTYISNHHYL